MPLTARQTRGRETQHLLSAYFRANGFPYAAAIISGRAGRDIENMPGLSPEVKATATWPGQTALTQAREQAGDDVPFVVWRQNGYGPSTIDKWPVFIHLDEFTRLLRLAGYGNPLWPATEKDGGDE